MKNDNHLDTAVVGDSVRLQCTDGRYLVVGRSAEGELSLYSEYAIEHRLPTQAVRITAALHDGYVCPKAGSLKEAI